MSVFLRLFAPFLPYVTEEVWSWWKEGSVHLAAWPLASEFESLTGDPIVLDVTAEVLSQVRRVKSDAKVSMKAPLQVLVLTDSADRIDKVRAAGTDLVDAANAKSIDFEIGPFEIRAELAPA